MIARTFSETEVLDALRAAIAAPSSADAWGRQHNYSPRHVRAVLTGERPIPFGFYAALGFARQTVIVRPPQPQPHGDIR